MSDSTLKDQHSIVLIIRNFLQQRLDAKLEKLLPDDSKRIELAAQFEPETWLQDAAHRVTQIHAVTHSLKPIHPDAKGTNLYRPPRMLAQGSWVGTHCLGDKFEMDVVGNAAALDVYKFLKLSHNGRTFLDLSMSCDETFLKALSANQTRAQEWAVAFAGLASSRAMVSSHTYAKQLYWLLDGEDYSAHEASSFHLLAPLYPSSLIQFVYQQIEDDRFSDEAKAARSARKNHTYHLRSVREYPNLAIQKLGGTKPQNISQLNSERRGNNYLLASVPPIWKATTVKPLLRTDSLFKVWGRRKNVTQSVGGLRRFLETDPATNAETRQRVRAFVGTLVDELIQFQAELLTLEPGWSQSEACKLPLTQRLWVDPFDLASSSASVDIEWEIAGDFGRWVNARLRNPLAVGDREFAEWRKLAYEQLQVLARGHHAK